MKLHLVRHGETTSNVRRALDTAHPGADLTERGRAQAAALVAAFEGLSFGAIYTSSRIRTQQTAAPLAGVRGLQPVVIDGLREIDAGNGEMRTDDVSRKVYVDTLAHWTLGNHEIRMPGAESGHEFLARFDEAVDAIAATGVEHALVVGHAAAIHAWVNARANLSAWGDAAYRGLHNTGGCELKGEPGDWTILDWHPTPYGA